MSNLKFYRQPVSRQPRYWNCRPQLVQYLPAFRRKFRGWGRTRNAKRAQALDRLCRILRLMQLRAIEDGERRFGVGRRLAGGSCEHWPREAKDACLLPAQARITYLSAMKWHQILAGVKLKSCRLPS